MFDILGPVLSEDYAPSILLVKRLLDGALPACPRLYFGTVDVRDVADLHVHAMTHPAANGERFIAMAGESMSLLHIATVLKKQMWDVARRVPTREMPDWIVRLLAHFVSDMKMLAPEVGKRKNISNDKARHVLGWTPRSQEESIVATAESLQRLGLLKH